MKFELKWQIAADALRPGLCLCPSRNLCLCPRVQDPCPHLQYNVVVLRHEEVGHKACNAAAHPVPCPRYDGARRVQLPGRGGGQAGGEGGVGDQHERCNKAAQVVTLSSASDAAFSLYRAFEIPAQVNGEGSSEAELAERSLIQALLYPKDLNSKGVGSPEVEGGIWTTLRRAQQSHSLRRRRRPVIIRGNSNNCSSSSR